MKLKIYSVLLFAITWLSFQPAKAQLKIQTIVPPTSENFSVCLDTFQIKVVIINDTTVVAENIEIKHSFLNGIMVTKVDSVSNVDSINTTDLTHPLFFTDSLAARDSIVFILSAFATCSFRDTNAFNSTLVNFFVNGTKFTNSYISNSYNLKSAVFTMEVINPKNGTSLSYNVGKTISPGLTIEICNFSHAATNRFTFTSVLEPEVELIQYHLYTLTGNFDDTTFVDTTGTIVIDDGLLKHLSGDTLFQGECITIEEQVRVISCTPGKTDYTVSWGCNNQNCQSIPRDANVNVQAGTPIVSCGNYSNPTKTYFNSPSYGTTVFMYKNTGTDRTGNPLGNGMATNIQFYLWWDTASTNLQNIKINNIPIASIDGLKYTLKDTVISNKKYKAYTFALDSVTDTRLNIADADGDSFFDDLYPKDSFLVAIDYTLSCIPSVTEQYQKSIPLFESAPLRYSNMCGVPQTVAAQSNYFTGYTNTSTTSTAVAPADVEKEKPATFTFCPEFIQVWTGPQQYFDCPEDSFYALLLLPKGFHLLSNPDTVRFKTTSPTVTPITTFATQSHDTVFIPIGKLTKNPSSNQTERNLKSCFDIELVLQCDPGVGSVGGTDTLELKVFHGSNMQYSCDDYVCYVKSETYIHPCDSCDMAVSTSSFTAERATFGWVDPKKDTYYTEATRDTATRITRAAADTNKNIKLNAAYPTDSVLMVIPGSIGKITTPLDSVMVEISYVAQNNKLPGTALFEFAGGTFQIIDKSKPDTLVCNVSAETVRSVKVESDTVVHHYVFIPRSCFPADSFAAGDSLLFRGYFKVKKNSISGYFYALPKLRAQYMAITKSGDTAHSCDSWGANFSNRCEKSFDIMYKNYIQSNNQTTDTKEIFNLYPNPTSGTMQLDYTLKEKQQGTLQIFDITGRKLKEFSLHPERNTLYITALHLSSGIYIYRIMTGNEKNTYGKLEIVK